MKGDVMRHNQSSLSGVDVRFKIRLRVKRTRGRFAHHKVRQILQSFVEAQRIMHPRWEMVLKEDVVK